MGTWIFAIGALVAIGAAGFIFWVLSDKPWAALAAGIVGVLVFGVAFFVASEVDPVFAGEHTTVTCVECGNKMNGNDAFCSECGLKLQEEKHCTECGEVIGNGDKFCADCGTKVDEE